MLDGAPTREPRRWHLSRRPLPGPAPYTSPEREPGRRCQRTSASGDCASARAWRPALRFLSRARRMPPGWAYRWRALRPMTAFPDDSAVRASARAARASRASRRARPARRGPRSRGGRARSGTAWDFWRAVAQAALPHGRRAPRHRGLHGRLRRGQDAHGVGAAAAPRPHGARPHRPHHRRHGCRRPAARRATSAPASSRTASPASATSGRSQGVSRESSRRWTAPRSRSCPSRPQKQRSATAATCRCSTTRRSGAPAARRLSVAACSRAPRGARGALTIIPTTADGLELLTEVLGGDLDAAGVLVIDLGTSEANAGNLDESYYVNKAALERAGLWNPHRLPTSPWAAAHPRAVAGDADRRVSAAGGARRVDRPQPLRRLAVVRLRPSWAAAATRARRSTSSPTGPPSSTPASTAGPPPLGTSPRRSSASTPASRGTSCWRPTPGSASPSCSAARSACAASARASRR